MIISALIINSPTSPKVSIQSHLPPTMPQLEYCSTDDDSDNETPCTHKINSDLKPPENDITTWHYHLAKSLISLHDNLHTIITNFDKISPSSFSRNTKIHREHVKIKLEMMRMVVMLHPSELPTYNNHERISPYTDLRKLENITKPLTEDEPYEHGKLRSKIQRIISRLKRGMEKLRLILFSSSYRDKSSAYIQDYREEIENSLFEIRTHMMEYNRINNNLQKEKQDDDEITKHQKTIQRILAEMKSTDPCIYQRVGDYKLKLKPYRRKANENYEFFSSPLITLGSRYNRSMIKIQDKDCLKLLTDERLVFPDLIREANEFFDLELLASALKHEEEENKENNQTISIENICDISTSNKNSIITTKF